MTPPAPPPEDPQRDGDAFIDLLSSSDDEAAPSPARRRSPAIRNPPRLRFLTSSALGADSDDDHSRPSSPAPPGVTQTGVATNTPPANLPPHSASASDSEDDALLAPVQSGLKRRPGPVKTTHEERIAAFEASCTKIRHAHRVSANSSRAAPTHVAAPTPPAASPPRHACAANSPSASVPTDAELLALASAVDDGEENYADAGDGNDMSELVPDLNTSRQGFNTFNDPLFKNVTFDFLLSLTLGVALRVLAFLFFLFLLPMS